MSDTGAAPEFMPPTDDALGDDAPASTGEGVVTVPPPPKLARGQVLFRTLGAAELHIGGIGVIGPGSERMFSLLAVCAMEPDHAIARARLLELVWPDMDDESGRHSLRQHTYRLRQYGIGLESTRASVVIDRASLVPCFALDRSSALFERDVLRGHEPFGHLFAGWVPSHAGLRDWLEAQRDAYHMDVRRVLIPELRLLRDRGQWEECERWARTVLEFDSFNEDATLILAEAVAMMGSRASAKGMLDLYVRETASAGTELGRRIEQAQQRILRAGRVSYDGSAAITLVGRDDVMARLDKLTLQSLNGHAQVVRVSGPAGIGKTEVAHEATRRAVILGFSRCIVRVSRSVGQVTHGTLSRMTRDLLNLPGSLGVRPPNLRLLRQFAGLEPATPLLDLVETLGTPSPLTECLIELITSIAEERPLFLFVDDLHYVDRQSLEEFERLADLLQRQQVVFLTTERDGETKAFIDDESIAHRTHILLAPLEPSAGVQLASLVQTSSGRRLSTEHAAQVALSSDRTPLQIITLAREQLHHGMTAVDSRTLRHSLRRQLERLSPTARTALQCVAVVGGKLPALELDRVLEVDFLRRVAAIRELLESGLAEDAGEQVLQCHDEVGVATLEDLSESELRLIQRQIAAAFASQLDVQFGAEKAVAAIELALKAGDRDLYVSSCLKFSDKIAEAGLVVGALRFLETARSLCSNDEQHARILALLAKTANRAANWQLVLKSADALRKIQRRSALPDTDMLLTELEASLRTQLLTRGNENAHLALEIARDTKQSYEQRARGIRLVMMSASDLFESELAISAYEVLQELASPPFDLDDHCIEPYLQFHTVFGDMKIAEATALRVGALSELTLLTPVQARLLCNACFTLRLSGNTQLAAERLERAFFSEALRHNPGRRLYAAWQISLISAERGDIAASVEWHKRVESISAKELDASNDPWLVMHRLRIELLRTRTIADSLGTVQSLERLSKTPTRSLLYATGLALAATTEQTEGSIRSELLAKGARYLREFGRFGGQDVLAFSLLRELSRRGLTEEARDMARRYILHDRRELFSPLPTMRGLPEVLLAQVSAAFAERSGSAAREMLAPGAERANSKKPRMRRRL